MKQFLLALFFAFTLASCTKTVEKTKEDAVIQIMVSGQWVVTKYTIGASTVTPDFAGYKFQFYENRTVDAIKNGFLQKSGTWEANAAALTIYSNFAGAIYPLSLLNGTFKITDSGLTFVEAKLTLNGELHTLRLEK